MEVEMDLKEKIEILKKPELIKEALYASSPTVLESVFDEDVNVKAVIGAGLESVALIEKEIKKNGTKFHDITLSCFAYILMKINISSAVKILRTVFPKIARRPGSFAAMFMARTLRMTMNLPVDPKELFFTEEQLNETVNRIT
jgi:hypothetical protein